MIVRRLREHEMAQVGADVSSVLVQKAELGLGVSCAINQLETMLNQAVVSGS